MRLSSKITTFKPKFGNVTHIKILEKMGELNDCIRILEKKRAESKGITTVKEKIAVMEKEIVDLIVFEESQRK